MSSDKVYLDNNATTPLAPEVIAEITSALNLWANPSSNNDNAKLVAEKIDQSRQYLAQMFGAQKDGVIFTSGGTESNNWIIHAAINRGGLKPPHIITTCIEHPSILEPLRIREEAGEIEVTYIPVNFDTGRVDVSTVIAALRPNTCLVTVMLANNETGVLQPVEEMFGLIRKSEFSPILHSDVAQAAGKLPINIDGLKADAITVVGHKFYGPRNGAFILRPNFNIPPMIYGGNQEAGRRSGTENTPMIVGLGEAARVYLANSEGIEQHLREVRDYFEEQLQVHLPTAHVVHFQTSARLPNTSSTALLNYSPHACGLVEKAQTFSASTGAACHKFECSPILKACGVPFSIASKTVRFSFGRQTTKSQVDTVIEELKNLCA